jgi:DNA end-binding protein Ku
MGDSVPRAIWKGSISFGLVNAPVAMYAAISERNLHFHLVHTKDMAPIGYQKTCKRHKRRVPDKEIARAYDLNGKTVLLEDRDFEAARADGYHAITVLDFVPHDQIDPVYFERTFYLGPADEGAEHVYALLARALETSGLSAICSYIFHQREQLGCVRSRDGVLLLEKLYFGDEVRPHREHRPRGQRIDRRELQMAQVLIDRMAGDFDIGRYRDRYRQQLMAVIRKKARGQEVTVPETPEPERAPDLMDALRASLDEARAGRRTTAWGRSRASDRKRPTIGELRKRAAQAGVEGRSKMGRAELERALRAA